MLLQSVEIRSVDNRHELEVCYDLWATVFPNPRSFFQERLDFDASYRLETTWVALVDGQIAAAVQVFPYLTWLDEVHVKNAGIGSVATLPAYRGLGLAQQILRQVSSWMKAEKFDLSLLFTGIYPYYEQVGWYCLEETQLVLQREQFSNHSAVPSLSYRVRKIQAQDLLAVAALYNKFNLRRTGARIRTEDYWEGLLRWSRGDFYVVLGGAEIVGYALAALDEDLFLQLKELVYLSSHPQASIALLAAVWDAYPAAQAVRVRLPSDHVLSDFLLRLTAQQTAFNPMMWQVVDVGALLQKLKPVLTRRSANLELAGETRTLWQIGGTQLVMVVQRDHVEVEVAQTPLRYQGVLKVSTPEFVQLVLRGATTLPDRLIGQFPYLSELFPKQPGLLWSSDFF